MDELTHRNEKLGKETKMYMDKYEVELRSKKEKEELDRGKRDEEKEKQRRERDEQVEIDLEPRPFGADDIKIVEKKGPGSEDSKSESDVIFKYKKQIVQII